MTKKPIKIKSDGTPMMRPCQCSHPKSWHQGGNSNENLSAILDCLNMKCKCKKYKEDLS